MQENANTRKKNLDRLHVGETFYMNIDQCNKNFKIESWDIPLHLQLWENETRNEHSQPKRFSKQLDQQKCPCKILISC